MPANSTPSWTVAAGSDEHKAIKDAMKDFKQGHVLCKEEGGKFSTKPMGPGKNLKYLEEGEE